MARIVASQPRSASSPPVNSASSATLSYNALLGRLEWRYYFSGDYDQNGVVSVSDLTPLAIQLGATVSDEHSAAGVCDGDGNGVVTLADLTPIGVNLGRRVEGYRVYSAASEPPYPAAPGAPNGSGAELAGSVLLSAAVSEQPGQRLAFSFDTTLPPATAHYWVRPYDAAEDGTPSNLLALSAAPNQPPVARLESSALGNLTPLRVNLSAAASSDDRGIVKYEWDLNGDGIYEYDSGLGSATPTWFYAPGSFTVGVRVSDADGLRATKTLGVNVAEGAKWHTQVVDDAANAVTDLLIVDGRPAVVYSYQPDVLSPSQFVYRRAGNIQASNWGPRVVLDTAPYSGRSVSAEMINGRPCVAYTRPLSGTDDLLYMRAENSTGTAWEAPILIGSFFTAAVLQNQCSLLEASGQPALAYVSSQSRLYFVRAEDSLGTSWPVGREIGIKATECVLGRIGDTLGVAFFRNTYSDLLYVASVDALGAAWSPPILVDGMGGAAGDDASLIEADGCPAIVHYDDSFEALKFVRAVDPEGTEWSDPLILASSADDSLAIDKLPDGRLTICFRKRDGSLNWIASNDIRGASWGRTVEMATDLHVSSKPSIAISGQVPCAVYGIPNGTGAEQIAFVAYY